MYYLCEKYYKYITVQYYIADCVSWVPRLTLLDLRTNWTYERALQMELVRMHGTYCRYIHYVSSLSLFSGTQSHVLMVLFLFEQSSASSCFKDGGKARGTWKVSDKKEGNENLH